MEPFCNEIQLRAIKRAIILGETLQIECPDVSDLYRNGESQADIAALLRERGLDFLPESEAVLENAVKFALIGNTHSMSNTLGSRKAAPTYTGLITSEEYSLLSKNHRDSSHSDGGKLAKKQKKGVFAMSSKELAQAARSAAKSRGEYVWEEDECARALELRQLPTYQRKGTINNKKIADTLNEEFYEGRTIRSRATVSGFFKRYDGKTKKA